MINLKWRTVLKLSYRRFGRQLEDTDLAFTDVQKQIQDLEPVRATFAPIADEYWPIRPESVSTAEKRGIFVFDREDTPTAVIRELAIVVLCDGFEDAEQRLDKILAVLPGKFACIAICREYLTETNVAE